MDDLELTVTVMLPKMIHILKVILISTVTCECLSDAIFAFYINCVKSNTVKLSQSHLYVTVQA